MKKNSSVPGCRERFHFCAFFLLILRRTETKRTDKPYTCRNPCFIIQIADNYATDCLCKSLFRSRWTFSSSPSNQRWLVISPFYCSAVIAIGIWPTRPHRQHSFKTNSLTAFILWPLCTAHMHKHTLDRFHCFCPLLPRLCNYLRLELRVRTGNKK